MADPEFTIEVMRVDEWDRCVEMNSETFTTGNPLVKHLRISRDRWRRVMEGVASVEKTVDTGLSLVALDVNGQPLASLIMQAIDLRVVADRSSWQEHFGVVVLMEIIKEMYQRSFSPSKLGLGSMVAGLTLHVVSGDTLPAVQSKGLPVALREAAVKHARERGFNRMLVEAIHPATVHMWTDLGFRTLSSTDVGDFTLQVNGSKPCRGVAQRVALCELTLKSSFRDHIFMYPLNLTRLFSQVTLGHYSSIAPLAVGALVIALIACRRGTLTGAA